MSFKVNWPKFSQEFLISAQEKLSEALNKGEEKPPNIADRIIVQDLYMGAKPPELEILEIGDLSEDRFKGVFKLTYTGDGFIVMQTKVQANPLNQRVSKRIIPTAKIYAANRPLVVPMQIRISNFCLRGVIVLVIDKHKGITLVFKNDPLESVSVSSTFDNIPNIKRLLQRQIESQLRKMFQDDLPQMIHQLSILFIQQQKSNVSSPVKPKGSGLGNCETMSPTLSLQGFGTDVMGSQSHDDRADYSPPGAFENSYKAQSFANLQTSTHHSSQYKNRHKSLSGTFAPSPLSHAFSDNSKPELTDEQRIKRPHGEKWTGNDAIYAASLAIVAPSFDPEIDENIILNKRIGPSASIVSPMCAPLGLKTMLDSPREFTSVSRTMSPAISCSDLKMSFIPAERLDTLQSSDFPLPKFTSMLSDDPSLSFLFTSPSKITLEESPLLSTLKPSSMSTIHSSSDSNLRQLFLDDLKPFDSVYSNDILSVNEESDSHCLDPSLNEAVSHFMSLCRMHYTLSPRSEINPFATFRSSPRLAKVLREFQTTSERIKRKIIKIKPPFRLTSSSPSSPASIVPTPTHQINMSLAQNGLTPLLIPHQETQRISYMTQSMLNIGNSRFNHQSMESKRAKTTFLNGV